MAVLLDVGDEAHVLLRRPGAPVQADLGAARCPATPHFIWTTPLLVLALLGLLKKLPSPGNGWTMQSMDRGEARVYMHRESERLVASTVSGLGAACGDR